MARFKNKVLSHGAFFLPPLIVLLVVSSQSCQESSSLEDAGDLKAITNRSTVDDPYSLVMVKLNSPPLLENPLHDSDGTLKADPFLLTDINRQQDQLISELSSLSEEIKVLYRYRFVLNGLALVVPSHIYSRLEQLPQVTGIYPSGGFSRPGFDQLPAEGQLSDLSQKNSVEFIGAEKVHNELKVTSPSGEVMPVRGQGIRIGVIDSGIDYTHMALGGSGDPSEYQSINPMENYHGFPNSKVVGGIDLVGSFYDASARELEKRIPVGNNNPLDESGHGTHVAGTIAGIGDGVNTYNGVAPDASLYAIKVFGKSGTTSYQAVIAGLEYAVDPNQDGNPNDHLDIVNLSLGSGFGLPHGLYDEAMGNLARAGITAVTSGGNLGDIPHIVSQPGASDSPISVAASVDHMEHNWKFQAISFSGLGSDPLVVKAVEGSITKPIAECSSFRGELVGVGLVDKELPPQQVQQLNGKVALIDRGLVPFGDKIRRVQAAGAIAAVVVNDRPGKPIIMGGDRFFTIPGVMIRQELGEQIKKALDEGTVVTIDVEPSKKFEEPELIDSLTDFSSRGPRSLDSVIKPELSAPGKSIISAKSGSGFKGTTLSGTSMAAPHVTGVVALLKQYRPHLSEQQIKSALLGSTKVLKERSVPYSISRQGCGRVQALEALKGEILAHPAAVSLGQHSLGSKKIILRQLNIENMGNSDKSLTLRQESSSGIKVILPEMPIKIAPGEHEVIPIKISLDPLGKNLSFSERSAHLYLEDQQNGQWSKLAIFGVVRKMSRIYSSPVEVFSSSAEDAPGALARVELKNAGGERGEALIFNLLAKNDRKPGVGPLKRVSDICDLESVGYRVVPKLVNGNFTNVLQIAAQHYSPLTNWNHCEISVQIDGNGSGLADQELLGTDASNLSDTFRVNSFGSILTDAHLMRDIRRKVDSGSRWDFTPAIEDFQEFYAYQYGSLAILEAKVDELQAYKHGLLKVKVASLVATSTIGQSDDFLLGNADQWNTIDPVAEMGAFFGFPEKIQLPPGETATVDFSKGSGKGQIVLYFPFNSGSGSVVQRGKAGTNTKNTLLILAAAWSFCFS